MGTIWVLLSISKLIVCQVVKALKTPDGCWLEDWLDWFAISIPLMRNFVSLRRHPGIAQKSFAGHLSITTYRLDKKTVKKARQQEKQGSATKDQTFQVESSTWNN